MSEKRKSHEPELVGPYGMPQGINTLIIGRLGRVCQQLNCLGMQISVGCHDGLHDDGLRSGLAWQRC